MSGHAYDTIKAHPTFAVMVRRKARWAWGLSAVIVMLYFSFIWVVAFKQHWLAVPIREGSVITLGVPLGLGIIVLSIVLTGWYVYLANTRFDAMNAEILRDCA